jgi:hypothetical protein
LKNSKKPSVWAHRTVRYAPDTALCTVRCTGWRAQISFSLCVVQWFTRQLLCAVRCAPDRQCRLSGALITRFFKKGLPSPEPVHVPSQFLALCLLSLSWRFPLSSLTAIAGGRAPVTPLKLRPCFSLPLVSCFLSPFSLSVSSVQCRAHPSTLLNPNQTLVHTCESSACLCSIVPLKYPYRFLAPFGRVSNHTIGISPKP